MLLLKVKDYYNQSMSNLVNEETTSNVVFYPNEYLAGHCVGTRVEIENGDKLAQKKVSLPVDVINVVMDVVACDYEIIDSGLDIRGKYLRKFLSDNHYTPNMIRFDGPTRFIGNDKYYNVISGMGLFGGIILKEIGTSQNSTDKETFDTIGETVSETLEDLVNGLLGGISSFLNSEQVQRAKDKLNDGVNKAKNTIKETGTTVGNAVGEQIKNEGLTRENIIRAVGTPVWFECIKDAPQFNLSKGDNGWAIVRVDRDIVLIGATGAFNYDPEYIKVYKNKISKTIGAVCTNSDSSPIKKHVDFCKEKFNSFKNDVTSSLGGEYKPKETEIPIEDVSEKKEESVGEVNKNENLSIEKEKSDGGSDWDIDENEDLGLPRADEKTIETKKETLEDLINKLPTPACDFITGILSSLPDIEKGAKLEKDETTKGEVEIPIEIETKATNNTDNKEDLIKQLIDIYSGEYKVDREPKATTYKWSTGSKSFDLIISSLGKGELALFDVITDFSKDESFKVFDSYVDVIKNVPMAVKEFNLIVPEGKVNEILKNLTEWVNTKPNVYRLRVSEETVTPHMIFKIATVNMAKENDFVIEKYLVG